jgi:hypothetical protein
VTGLLVIGIGGSAFGPGPFRIPAPQVTSNLTVAVIVAPVVVARHSAPQSGAWPGPAPDGGLPTGYLEPSMPQPAEYGVPGPETCTVNPEDAGCAQTVADWLPSVAVTL